MLNFARNHNIILLLDKDMIVDKSARPLIDISLITYEE